LVKTGEGEVAALDDISAFHFLAFLARAVEFPAAVCCIATLLRQYMMIYVDISTTATNQTAVAALLSNNNFNEFHPHTVLWLTLGLK